MDEPVVILCGGRGTRLREHTQTIPKPLVEIGGRPILWHVIRIYAHQGFHRFVLCLGHKGELIEEFVRNNGLPEGLSIDCVQTGEETPTGGRIARVRDRVEDGRFCVTYADGVADIDLHALVGLPRGARRARHLDRGSARAPVRRRAPERRGRRGGLRGEAAVPGLDQRRLLRLRAGSARLHRGRLRPRARPAREPRPRTASCAPTGTPASGTAWTPTRTRSSSTTCGRRGGRPGRNLHRLRRKPRA